MDTFFNASQRVLCVTGCTLFLLFMCADPSFWSEAPDFPLVRLLSTVSTITHDPLSRCRRPLFVCRQLKVAVVLPACPGRLLLILMTMYQENIGCEPSPSDLYSVRCIFFVYEAVHFEHPSHV